MVSSNLDSLSDSSDFSRSLRELDVVPVEFDLPVVLCSFVCDFFGMDVLDGQIAHCNNCNIVEQTPKKSY